MIKADQLHDEGFFVAIGSFIQTMKLNFLRDVFK